MSTSTSRRPPQGGQRHGAHGGGSGGEGEGGGGGGGGGGGPLVKVGFGRNQVEAEMLQGLLLDAGIPSVLKRSFGFDNPDFLAGGPHDVYVNQAQAKEAREVLAETMLESEGEERAEVEGELRRYRGGDPITPAQLAFWLGVAVVGGFVLVWVLYQLT
ncbi:MAG TPA: DUF2007 domain-containing protein [Solirubrobacterales bacterium]|nr:DUF2007 domain-containing protein [Solirubrobacterales bacterium]